MYTIKPVTLKGRNRRGVEEEGRGGVHHIVRADAAQRKDLGVGKKALWKHSKEC